MSSSSSNLNVEFYDEEEILVAASIDGYEDERDECVHVNDEIDELGDQEWSNSNSSEPLSTASSSVTQNPNIINILNGYSFLIRFTFFIF